MGTITFTRKDVESLCDRLEAKAWSNLFLDMPDTQRDIRSAAALLRTYIQMGVPVTTITVSIIGSGGV
jgi:hypothetical protein